MFRLLFCALCLMVATPSAFAGDLTDCSRLEVSGARTLCVESELSAPVADVWALWSESALLETWMAPVAAIELRPGGIMEASYDAAGRIGDAGNILNRVVAVAPLRSFTIQVERAPPGFPHAQEVRELVTLIEFAASGSQVTRVRVSMTGFREGAAFDELYAFFARGNAWTLQKLQERVLNGPVDWEAAQR